VQSSCIHGRSQCHGRNSSNHSSNIGSGHGDTEKVAFATVVASLAPPVPLVVVAAPAATVAGDTSRRVQEGCQQEAHGIAESVDNAEPQASGLRGARCSTRMGLSVLLRR